MMNSLVQAQSANDSFYVKVQNNGGYLAEFYLTYTVDGVQYNLDSGAFSVGFSRTLNFPTNSTSVYLKIEIWIFGGLRVVYDNYLPDVKTTCLLLYGTIFNPTCIDVPCNSIGSGDNSNSCCTPCCCCCNCNSTCNNLTYSNPYGYSNYYNGCQ